MTQEEVMLAKEVVEQLIDDMRQCCVNAQHRLNGQLLPDHVANAAMVVMVEALVQYHDELRPLMTAHIIGELQNIPYA